MRFRGKQANEWCLMCGRGWPSGTNGARTMPRHIWARGEGIFLKNLGLKYFYTKREGGDNGQRNIWGLFLLSLQPKIHKSSNSTDPTKLTRHFHVLQNGIFCYCWSMSTTVLLWTSRLIQRHMTHFNQMKIIILWSILILNALRKPFHMIRDCLRIIIGICTGRTGTLDMSPFVPSVWKITTPGWVNAC